MNQNTIITRSLLVPNLPLSNIFTALVCGTYINKQLEMLIGTCLSKYHREMASFSMNVFFIIWRSFYQSKSVIIFV